MLLQVLYRLLHSCQTSQDHSNACPTPAFEASATSCLLLYHAHQTFLDSSETS